jgi:hypothetical protein
MPRLSKPLRKKDIEALEAPDKLRLCALCGADYTLGDRVSDGNNKKFCDKCREDKRAVSRKAKATKERLAKKGIEPDNLPAMMSAYEAEVELRANELLAAYMETMKLLGAGENRTLLTLNPPTLIIASHDESNEFTPYLKQIFLNLYVKMPRQVLMILEHLGISEQRFKRDMNKYPEFFQAVSQCDKKHTELLEIISYHNAMNPKATSERIFLLKAGDPQRYRESFKGDTYNLGQMNIVVSSNVRGLGIPKNEIAGGGKSKN